MSTYTTAGKEQQADQMEGIQFPTEKDVLLGRGGGTNHHPGNHMFRNLVRSCRYRYEESKKFQKLEVARTVVLKVREAGGRFLTFDRKVKLYFDVGDTKALAKASQALRDSVYDIQKDGEGGNNGKPRIVPVSLVQLAPVGEAPILPVGGDEKKVEETAGGENGQCMNWERAKRVELEAELAKLKHHITRLEGEAVNLQSKLKESSEKVKTLEVTNKVLRDLHGNEAEYGVGNFFK